MSEVPAEIREHVEKLESFRKQLSDAKTALISFSRAEPPQFMMQPLRLAFDHLDTTLVWSNALIMTMLNEHRMRQDAAEEAISSGKVVEFPGGK